MSDTTVLSFLVEAHDSASKTLRSVDASLASVQSRLRELDAMNGKLAASEGKYAESVKGTTAAQNGANAATAKTAETTKAAATEYQRAGAAATEMGAASKRGADATAAGAATADGSVQRLSRTHAQAASEATKHSNALTSLGTSLTTAGRKTSDFGHSMSAISLPLGVAGAASLKLAIDFQKDMTLISTQANAGEAEVKKMTKAILDLAPKVGQTPDQLAKALFPIESVGIRGRDALNALKLAAEGAAIGETSVVDVSNTLVSVLKSQIGGVKDASDAMAQMNAIVGEGKMHMQDLTGALSTGILATAKGVSLTFRDIGAALDFFTAQGTPAEQAATRLKQTLSLMENPSTKAIGALQGIGLNAQSLANDMQKPNGLLVAVQDLKKHLDETFPPSGGHKLSIEQQAQALDRYKQTLEGAGVSGKKLQNSLDAFKLKLTQSGSAAVEQAQVILSAFGGGRMGATMLAMVENADQLKQKYQDLADGAGAKKFAAAWGQTQKDTAHQLKVMEAVAATTGIKFGQDMLPALNDVLKTVESLLKGFEAIPAPVRHVIEGVAILGAAIGPVAVAVGGITKGFGAIARLGGMVLPGRAGEAAGKGGGLLQSLGGGGLIFGSRNTSVMAGSLTNPIAVVMEGGFGERGSPFAGGGGAGGTGGAGSGGGGILAFGSKALGVAGIAAAAGELVNQELPGVRNWLNKQIYEPVTNFFTHTIPGFFGGNKSVFGGGTVAAPGGVLHLPTIGGGLAGTGNQIVPPAVGAGATAAANALKSLNAETSRLGQTSTQTHGKTADLSNAFRQQKNAADVARGGGQAFGQNLLAVADGLQTTRARTNTASQGLTSLGGVFGHLGSQLDTSKQKNDAANKSLGQTKPNTDAASQGLKSLGTIFDKFSSQLDNQRTKNDSTNKSLQNTKPSADTASGGIRSLGSIVDHYSGQAQNAKSKTDLASTSMRAAKPAADTASQGVANLGTTFDNTAHTAGGAMANIQSNVDGALKALGAKPVSFSLTAVGQAISGHARGGLVQIGTPGATGPDSIPMNLGGMPSVVAPGEQIAVLNHEQQAELNARTADVGGLHGFFSTYNTPHHMGRRRFASGGYVFPFPAGAPVTWERVDQGQDIRGPAGGDVLSIGPGSVSVASPDPGGFGDHYPLLTLSAGPLAGRTVYYGHTKVKHTGGIATGQVISQTGFGTGDSDWQGNASGIPGHLEIGFWPPGSMSSGGAMAAIMHALAGHTVAGMLAASIKSPKIGGPAGAWRTLAQSAADTVTKAANAYIQKQMPVGPSFAPGATGPAAHGPAHFAGKVSTFGPPGEPAGQTASGVSDSAPGIALFERGTLGQMFRVSIGGHSGLLRHIDVGPAPWTGRVIDVTGAGASQIGINPSGFPTDSFGTADLVGVGNILSGHFGRGGMVAPFVGSYQDGGTVPADGLAYVHQGETITSASARSQTPVPGYNPITGQVEWHTPAEWRLIHAEAQKNAHDHPHHKGPKAPGKHVGYNSITGRIETHTSAEWQQIHAREAQMKAKHDREVMVGGQDYGEISAKGSGPITLSGLGGLSSTDFKAAEKAIDVGLKSHSGPYDAKTVAAILKAAKQHPKNKQLAELLASLAPGIGTALKQGDIPGDMTAVARLLADLRHAPKRLIGSLNTILTQALKGAGAAISADVTVQGQILTRSLKLKGQIAGLIPLDTIEKTLGQDAAHLKTLYQDALKRHNRTLADSLLDQLVAADDALEQVVQARVQAIADRFEPTVQLQDTALQILQAQQKLAGTDNATLSTLKGNQGGVLTPAQIAAARAATAAQNQDIQAEVGTKQQEMAADQALLPTLHGTDASTMQQTIASLELSILTLQGTVHDNNQSLQDLTKATDQNTTATQNLTTSGTLTVSYQNDVFAIGGRQSSDEAAILGTGV